MATNQFIESLRDALPNTEVMARLKGQRYSITGTASTLVRDFDSLTADVEHYKAEAEKWQALALKLADKV